MHFIFVAADYDAALDSRKARKARMAKNAAQQLNNASQSGKAIHGKELDSALAMAKESTASMGK